MRRRHRPTHYDATKQMMRKIAASYDKLIRYGTTLALAKAAVKVSPSGAPTPPAAPRAC